MLTEFFKMVWYYMLALISLDLIYTDSYFERIISSSTRRVKINNLMINWYKLSILTLIRKCII